MDAASTPNPVPVNAINLQRLSPIVLLVIYGIVPVMLYFLLLDYFFTGLQFSNSIAHDSKNLLLVGLLLQVPHTIASLLTFVDREYATAYKGKLVKCALVGLGSIALLPLTGEVLVELFLITYNFYHQGAQQAGIAAIVARNKSRLHEVWRWMSMAILWTGFIAILIKNDQNTHISPAFTQAMTLVSGLFLAGFGVVSALVARQSRTGIGRLYIGANSLMLFAYVGLYYLNLPLLMIFIPVFVHDISAFAFYINHNTNRNRDTKFNLLSRIRNTVPMPEYILTPAVAILLGVALVMNLGLDASFLAYGGILLNAMHFYIEGVMWKGSSLHRKHILV